jgi:hypothetical protein
MNNQELYEDPQVFGLIEDMRDNPVFNSFKLAWNLRLIFGQGTIQRADITPFGPSRTSISADEALEVLFDHEALPEFVSGIGPRD